MIREKAQRYMAAQSMALAAMMSVVRQVVTLEPFGSVVVLLLQHPLQRMMTLPTQVKVEETLALVAHSFRKRTLKSNHCSLSLD